MLAQGCKGGGQNPPTPTTQAFGFLVFVKFVHAKLLVIGQIFTGKRFVGRELACYKVVLNYSILQVYFLNNFLLIEGNNG